MTKACRVLPGFGLVSLLPLLSHGLVVGALPSAVSASSLAILALSAAGTATPAWAQPHPAGEQALRLPVLRQVGLIPISVDGVGAAVGGLEKSLATLEQEWPQAVRRQQRFHVMADELVKGMWQTPALRHELQEDYELSAFIHLTLSPREDAVVLIARLLSPELEPYLQEEATFSRSAFAGAERSELVERCRDLIARLINRLPVDVSVSSVQGAYLTLTGGREQGLRLGDTLALERVWVTDRHPALKTWRGFKRVTVGEAKVIELSETVAVAEVVSLIREDDVAPGDGSRVAAIAGRLRFARGNVEPTHMVAADTIIVAPLYPSAHLKEVSKDLPAPAPLAPGRKLAQASGEAYESSDGTPEAEGGGPQMEGSSEGAEPAGEGESQAEAPSPEAARPRRIQLFAAQGGWSYVGPGSTGSRMVWYLPLNRFGGSYGRAMNQHWSYRFGGDIQLGKTQTGRSHYMGYNGSARIYWQDDLGLMAGDYWQAGGLANLLGFSVAKGPFGGYDMMWAGIYAGVGGILPDVGVQPLDWFAELQITPLALGRLGYDNAHHGIRSAFGWQLSGGVWQKAKPNAITAGLSLTYDSHLFLDNSAESTALTQYSAAIMARWELP